jgi:hypothetical protein
MCPLITRRSAQSFVHNCSITVQKLQYNTHGLSMNLFIAFLYLFHGLFLWLVHALDLDLHL